MPIPSNESAGCGVLFIKGLPPAVKNRWKAFCSRRGISMRMQLEKLMREDIAKDTDLALDLKRVERAQRTKSN